MHSAIPSLTDSSSSSRVRMQGRAGINAGPQRGHTLDKPAKPLYRLLVVEEKKRSDGRAGRRDSQSNRIHQFRSDAKGGIVLLVRLCKDRTVRHGRGTRTLKKTWFNFYWFYCLFYT